MEGGEENIERNLLQKTNEVERGGGLVAWSVISQEVRRQAYLAGPMVATNISLYLLEVMSFMMVGHLDELSLSSTAVAISLANVTGFSVINGMASALETLCGQAFGAQQYRKLGNQTYGAIFSLLLVSVGLSTIWINMGKLLILLGQDPIIAHEAGKFTTFLVPALFAYATYQPLLRFYQTQSIIMPMLMCSCLTLILHIPISWVMVYKSGLNSLGGALAIGMSYWLNVLFLGLHMKHSSVFEKTRIPISMELFKEIREFFHLAIPSSVMVCLQWWSYEVVILLAGLLPNPQLETSVLSVCLTTLATLFAIPYGLSVAVSTRVSNELGAGNPEAARVAVYSVLILAVTELLTASGAVFASRHVFGYLFSSEKEVVDYVATIAPLVSLSVIIDSSQCVLSGVARGCGWQNIGAYINLASLYLVGVPAAAILGFWLHLKARGLWIGIQLGAIVQTTMLFVVTYCTDWEKQAIKARERVFARRTSQNVLV
ncbi:hypothetical protein Tsubulata_039335 [Turnera subulata]|uniref:Protein DETOXIFICATION n=1 Tax=Turnera subulata TaxID=218843 RepID=A0A9Q0FGH4_9ROSI|nr:hypothetical protein Tsubulata_039335 [Turnera subulata]